MIITMHNFPRIHEAFDNISHDGGGRCHDAYEVPDRLAEDLPPIEAALRELNDLEFQDFCIGEEQEMLRIQRRDVRLLAAHELLDEFWNDWPHDEIMRPS